MRATADWVTAGASVFAAVGTVGAFIAALVQIKREREARKRVEREARDRERRAQAEQISAWPTGDDDEHRTPIALLNRSGEPVYRAVVTLVFIQGAAPRTGREVYELGMRSYSKPVSVIPPGRYETAVAGGWGALTARPGIELAFTDRAGIHWLRDADGALSELPDAPLAYYGVEEPVDWIVPTEST